MKNRSICFLIGTLFISSIFLQNVFAQLNIDPNLEKNEVYQSYLDFFEEIYLTMDQKYYYPIRRNDFDRFLKKFDSEIYTKIDDRKNFDDFISMRSGALLVDFLKTKEDIFSALFPPQAVDDFKDEVLGRKSDLGIEGELTEQGYRVTFIEPRSDAFLKGLRVNDVLISIDGKKVLRLTVDKIIERLTPEISKRVKIRYFDTQNHKKTIVVVSKEYFKQTVFPVATYLPNVYCLLIERFNRKTSEDLSRYLFMINQQGSTGLILDLRGNPGGPPLAAREILSFFLEPSPEFVYFLRKDDHRNTLDVPEVPLPYRYSGPIAILVDEKSGSASELFSGVMQKQNRAVLLGKRTAGQVFLKSMFNLDNDSMLVLVTARGYFPNGEAFDFDGLMPQVLVDNKGVDLLYFAAGFLQANLSKNIF